MIDEYAIDTDFKDVMSTIALGKIEESFHVNMVIFSTTIDYVLHIICVTKLCMNPTLLLMRDIEGFKLHSRKQRCTFNGPP